MIQVVYIVLSFYMVACCVVGADMWVYDIYWVKFVGLHEGHMGVEWMVGGVECGRGRSPHVKQ